jgi:hypothetical protein
MSLRIFGAWFGGKARGLSKCKPSKQSRILDSFLHEAAQNFFLPNIQDQKSKIKNL